MRSITLIR